MNDGLTLIFDAINEQGLPHHFRSMTGPWVRSMDTQPSRLGLDTLLASGSEQPSRSELAGTIRGLAKTVVVVDLRQESHAFLGEHPVSWYGVKNWANSGKTLAQVEADEGLRIAALARSASVRVARVTAKDAEGSLSAWTTEDIPALEAQSEEQVARGLGLGTLRIPVTDHSRPLDADVDRFVFFIRTLAPGTWLHFHCHAGDGRTTTFLLLYDMLRNAGLLGLEELAARHSALGGVDVLHSPHTGWKASLYAERAAFLTRFFEYARTRDYRTVDWSGYIAG